MTNTWRFIFALSLTLSFCLGNTTPCGANAPVVLKPTAEIKSFAVRLSDLFDGVPPPIDREIAQAPAPCKPSIYDTRVLNKLADTYRLDWQPQNGIDHAVVTTACSRITSDMIRDAVIAKLKQDNPAKGRVYEVTLDNHNLEIDLPATEQPRIDLNNFSYDATAHHFRGDLSTQTLRGATLVPLSGYVAVKRPVPVLAHRMESGTVIAESDLDWVPFPEERITPDVVTEMTQLVGREIRRDKAEADIIRAHDIAQPRLVLRGSLVTLRIVTPFMTATTQGKAQQDGAAGDTIRVMNTQSNRTIEGIVTAAGCVDIQTTQKVALAQ